MRYSAQSVSIDRRPGPVFDSPELQARSHRVIYSVMTLAAWLVWAWLWLPLVTLLGWYLGIRTFLREIVIPDPAAMRSSLLTYLLVILSIGILLTVWSRYNVFRFRGQERRGEVSPVTDSELSDTFRISSAALDRFRDEDSLVLEHDEDGRLAGVFASSSVVSIRSRTKLAAAGAAPGREERPRKTGEFKLSGS
jgi:biofilm PGA synthesis protein PgaD